MPEESAELELAEGGDSGLATSDLLGSYDRLRRRIVDALDRRGRLGRTVAGPLMLAPDLLVLLARLCLDREVSPASRQVIIGALVYFVTPIDLLPEAFVGLGGFLDDVVLASLVLHHSLDADLEPLAAKHWSGSQDLRRVLADVAGAAAALLGFDLSQRLKRFLARRGIRVENDS
jgi:uncharacterized membrane protein YkvA (DUF1232 family)